MQQALGEKALERDRIMTLFRRGRIALQDAELHLDVIERETVELRTALGAIQAQQDLAEAFAAHYQEAATLLGQLRARLDMIESPNDVATKRQVVELLVAGIRVDTVGTGKDKRATIAITYTFTSKRAVDSTIPCSSSPQPQRCLHHRSDGLGRAD